jgi:hypothetical protein
MTRKSPVKKEVVKVEHHQFMNNDANANTAPSANKVVAAQMTTANLNNYIAKMSNFDALKDDQVFEQMYKHEGDIGSGIDRVSTLVSESFKGVYTKDVGVELEANEAACLADAKKIYESMRVDNLAESYSEVIMKNGNLYIDYRDKLSPSILPNQYVTFIPDMKYKNMSSQMLFTDPKYLIVNERLDPKFESEVIKREEYIHVKYKDTPVMAFDNLNRQTFGIYSISPLHRCIIPVWWKRQMLMIDTLLRSKLVPKEHHQILSDMFTLDNYSGTVEEQHAKQAADVQVFISNYIKAIKEQAVDQGYVTLDTIDIKSISSDMKYTEPNDLIKQIQGDIYTGLNVPSSMVNGKDAGSYASELVISNYVSSKVIQLAKKVKYVILQMIRDRLLLINASYPVEIIDIKLELTLAMSKLEAFRQLSLMVAAGVFTMDEIRAAVAYEALTEEQKELVISTGKLVMGTPDTMTEDGIEGVPVAPGGPNVGSTANNVAADSARGGDGEDAEYPDTESSKQSHTRDASEEILRNK